MNVKSASLTLFALLAATPLSAKPAGLVVRTGETWIFAIDHGQPANARRVDPSAKPGKREVQVAVRAIMGTTMTISSNNPVAYSYRAELLGADKAMTVRACTLPAGGRMAFETWPQRATAVRLRDFKPAPAGGSCP